MGRSVERHSDARVSVFLDVSWIDERDYPQEEWNDFRYDLQHTIGARFPSMHTENRSAVHGGFSMRETIVILENEHAEVMVSEYCGLAWIGLVPNQDYRTLAFAPTWCERVAESFTKCIVEEFPKNVLRSVCRASNGEEFFERLA